VSLDLAYFELASLTKPSPTSPPFHEARTQPELAVLIREGKIPDLPKPYTAHLGQVVRAMLKQNVRRAH
jgi:hypothetical protein